MGTLSALLGINRVNTGSIETYDYDNRGQLRSIEQGTVIVEGLGLFQWKTASTELDDDESCFATANGRWLLLVPDIEYMEAAIDDSLSSTMFLYPSPISSMSGATTISFLVDGVIVDKNDIAIARPVKELAISLIPQCSINEFGQLKITINNVSGVDQLVPTPYWLIKIV